MVAPPSSNPFGFQVSDRTKMTSGLFGRAVLPSSSVGSYVNQQLAGINGVQSGSVGTPDPQAIRTKLTQQPNSMALEEGGPVSIADRSRKVGTQIADSNARILATMRAAQKRRAAAGSGSSGGGGAVSAAGISRQGGTGGPALGRVQGILKNFPGLRITEVGGNRDYDVAHGVARVPTSYHYDRANPAIDIAGSTAELDRLYRELVRQGGWRQILWRTAGHYDHIHVA